MVIRTIITGILAIYAYFLTARHNMHMLQLNGYKNNEQISWLKQNLKRQWLLLFGFVIGIIRLFFSPIGLDIFIYLILILDILVYRAIRRLNNKKKLNYTPRVKRMIATNIVLELVIFFALFSLLGTKAISGIALIIVSIQWWMNIVSNEVNHPIEAMINQHYINDAKRILKGMPNLKIIGITGSYGKTSVKFFLQTLLQSKYDVLVTPGNFNTTLGVTRTIREHMKPSNEIFLCEMGARYVGDIKEICDLVHPDMGIITSIGPQHLDTFGDVEHIKSTKFELADSLPKDGLIFLNGDNEYINDKASGYPNKVFYRTTSEGEGYVAKNIKVSQYGTSFTVVSPDNESEDYQMRLLGNHNVINVVGAIAVANTMGMSLKELKIPVRRLEPVNHRMQLRESGEVTIIDDAYNSNPVGSKAAVETLKMFDGVKILITPGMVELGEDEAQFNYKFGEYAAKACDYILLVHKEHSKPIREGALAAGFPEDKCFTFNKFEEAMSYAYNIKDSGHKYILIENDLPDNY